MKEIWKNVPGFQGYQVSSLGRAKSLDRMIQSKGDQKRGPYQRKIPGKLLEASRDAEGYRHVYKVGRIHRAVLLAFVGPCPEGQEVRHRDGDKENNSLKNLLYGTRSENQLDRVGHGTSHRGEQHPMVKLTTQQVIVIKKDRGATTQRALAKRFGVTAGCVRSILIGRNWGWLCL